MLAFAGGCSLFLTASVRGSEIWGIEGSQAVRMLQVAIPGAPSSVLAPSSKARSP